MAKEKKQGEVVADVKEQKEGGPQQVQVVTGNTQFLTVKLLGDILNEMRKITAKLEEVDG